MRPRPGGTAGDSQGPRWALSGHGAGWAALAVLTARILSHAALPRPPGRSRQPPPHPPAPGTDAASGSRGGKSWTSPDFLVPSLGSGPRPHCARLRKGEERPPDGGKGMAGTEGAGGREGPGWDRRRPFLLEQSLLLDERLCSWRPQGTGLTLSEEALVLFAVGLPSAGGLCPPFREDAERIRSASLPPGLGPAAAGPGRRPQAGARPGLPPARLPRARGCVGGWPERREGAGTGRGARGHTLRPRPHGAGRRHGARLPGRRGCHLGCGGSVVAPSQRGGRGGPTCVPPTPVPDSLSSREAPSCLWSLLRVLSPAPDWRARGLRVLAAPTSRRGSALPLPAQQAPPFPLPGSA